MIPHRFLQALLLTIAVSGNLAPAADVIILRQRATGSDQRQIDGFLAKVRKPLKTLGLELATINDRDLTSADLDTCQLLVLPYNPSPPDRALTLIEAFIEDGGKLGVFYSSNPRLLEPLGIESTRYLGRPELPVLQGIRLDTSRLTGAPTTLRQGSWNVIEPTPQRPGDTALVGTWLDQDGNDTGLAAVTLNQTGFVFAHVLLDEDPAGAAQLMLALVGRFVPEVWPNAVRQRLAEVRALVPGLTAERPEGELFPPVGSSANGASAQAVEAHEQAVRLLAEGAYAEAYAAAGQSVESATEAFLTTVRPSTNELRGAWIHSPYGIAGWDWDRTVKALADNGFNAIFPNLLWGAVADYPSDVLPTHPQVAEKGDQLQKCVEACRKYGIELHVWKVNWNMGHHTPKEVRERFRAAGRTQVDIDGKPSSFLAPHLQENFELELNSLLEVLQKYDVDGIHLDYIRYPNNKCDFSDSARAAFEAWSGQPAEGWPTSCYNGRLRDKYNEWRRGNITRLVKAVYEGAHALDPDIKVSAAVFGGWESTPESIAQATVEWIEDGLLDFVCPMNYTASDGYLERLLELQTAAVGGRIPLYCGLGTWLHKDAVQTAEQILLTRRLGADGFICFQHRARFAQLILPGLAQGATRGKACFLPHHSPKANFTPLPSREELEGYYRTGEPLRVHIDFDPTPPERIGVHVSLIRDGEQVERSSGRVHVEKSDDRLACSFVPEVAGRYRLEVTGYLQRPGEPPQALLRRSGPLCVLTDAEAEARIARAGLPQFSDNGGIRTAVWQHDAYGAKPILDALSSVAGLDAAPLYNLKEAALDACDVIVIPQPRLQAKQFREQAAADQLAAYVERGGGLLTTHALVGIRGFIPCIPAVAVGVDAVEGAAWKASAEHRVTVGLMGEEYESTFGDRVTVTPGESGHPVVVTEDNVPVVAVGQHGNGRYVACGLGIAIGPSDSDIEPSTAELQLVINAVHWLAENVDAATPARAEP